jgi:hypothetical protein
MANDPLPLPDISAGPPDDSHDAPRAQDTQDAEYEAIHAEIAATERGRWFLSEHVKRNPAADTDRLVGSLARAEAALRGGAAMAMPRALADDLAQLAAAIGQIESVIAANAAPAAGGLAAGERIQDIAVALRERETDSTLCEALEVALFELGEAFAQHDAAAERAQSAAALLRGLEASIDAMITLAEASPSGEATADTAPPVLAAADAPEQASPVQSGPDDSEIELLHPAAPVEPPAVESVALPVTEPAGPPVADPVELPVAEAEPMAHAGPVTPTMWETPAPLAAEMRTSDRDAPRDANPEDDEEGASHEPAPGRAANEEILPGSLSDEGVASEALAQSPASSEAAVTEASTSEASMRPAAASEQSISELLAISELPHDEAPSGVDETAAAGKELATAGEEASGETSAAAFVSAEAVAQAVEPVLDVHAETVEFTGAPAAADEDPGIAAPPADADTANTGDAVETRWSPADEIELLLDIEPTQSSPPPVELTSPQEDLDDLFEPLPAAHAVPPVAVSAVQREAGQQTSPDLPAPTASSPATQAMALPVQARPPAAAGPAPVAQAIPRPAPNDPLAAVRALSAEELIALFS